MNEMNIDSLGTETKTIYFEDYRKIYIKNNKNKSNFYTIIKEKLINEKYELYSKLEIGEKYVSYFKYEKNHLILERRFNKKIKTTFSKELFLKNDKGEIYIDQYQGKKNINFNFKQKDNE